MRDLSAPWELDGARREQPETRQPKCRRFRRRRAVCVEIPRAAGLALQIPKTVTVVVVSDGGRWSIDDVLYPDGVSLVELLGRLEYDSFGT